MTTQDGRPSLAEREDGGEHSLKEGLDRAEPMNEERRTLQTQGASDGGSICANITMFGANYHGFEVGQSVLVRTFREGILIVPAFAESQDSEEGNE